MGNKLLRNYQGCGGIQSMPLKPHPRSNKKQNTWMKIQFTTKILLKQIGQVHKKISTINSQL